jgi:hypothetical protein
LRYRLARRVNFRRTLLAAVDAFNEGTPTSIAKAHRLVQRCDAARQFTTLDEIVWGGIISSLSDSLFYEYAPALLKFRTLITKGSNEVHRAYLNYDFRDDFTQVEQDWYARLREMLDFFDDFPFRDVKVSIAEYKRRTLEIERLASQSPPQARLGDEMIYHFILREVTEITTTIGLSPPLLARGRIVPVGEHSAMPPQTDDWLEGQPNPRESLKWARKALRSIVEDGWMLITWQVTRHHYNLSLH